MQTTLKTFGIVLIGLVGLLAYLGIQIGSFAGIGIAGAVTWFGLVMTAVMLVFVVYLTYGKLD